MNGDCKSAKIYALFVFYWNDYSYKWAGNFSIFALAVIGCEGDQEEGELEKDRIALFYPIG